MIRRAGLIGYPIDHSLSPAIQQAAFDELGISARYELWPTLERELPDRVNELRRPEMLGANVTLPYKGLACDLVDEMTERAQHARAVNTILNQNGLLIGENTDIPGFLAPLHDREISLSESRVIVLGAGGAARAVVVALLLAGCSRISIGNRTPQRAAAMIGTLHAKVPIWFGPLDASLGEWLEGASLLVNATSVGWDDQILPLDPALLDLLPAHALVYDLTYRETPLLRQAAALGYQTLDGLEMLVQQGAESFRFWTGKQPPLELMRRAAQAAAADRG